VSCDLGMVVSLSDTISSLSSKYLPEPS
jgi:hypothetical protein